MKGLFTTDLFYHLRFGIRFSHLFLQRPWAACCVSTSASTSTLILPLPSSLLYMFPSPHLLHCFDSQMQYGLPRDVCIVQEYQVLSMAELNWTCGDSYCLQHVNFVVRKVRQYHPLQFAISGTLVLVSMECVRYGF